MNTWEAWYAKHKDDDSEAARTFSGEDVARDWGRWCGETSWVKWMRRWGRAGGRVVWWCGYPQSASAIPLCFSLVGPSGDRPPCKSLLRDIRAAVLAAGG